MKKQNKQPTKEQEQAEEPISNRPLDLLREFRCIICDGSLLEVVGLYGSVALILKCRLCGRSQAFPLNIDTTTPQSLPAIKPLPEYLK